MKAFIFICVSLFVGLSSGDTVLYPRGCIYILGRCAQECPVGTHAYALGCGKRTPEPTCAEPNPVEDRGILCDYSACYCDPPTIRDEKTNKCVLKEECSAQDVPTVTLLPPFEELKPTSEVPVNPDAPSAPEIPKPEAPSAPEVPKPEAEAKHDAPSASDTPAKPDAPVASDTPAKPDAPSASDTPETAKTPEPVNGESPPKDQPEEKKE